MVRRIKTWTEKAYKPCVSKRLVTSEAKTEKAYENKSALTDEAIKEKIWQIAMILKSFSAALTEFIIKAEVDAKVEDKVKAEVDAEVEAKVEDLLWAETISEMSSYSKMRKTKNTVSESVSCNNCRWFKAAGNKRYGHCGLWKRMVKASTGCLQKEVPAMT